MTFDGPEKHRSIQMQVAAKQSLSGSSKKVSDEAFDCQHKLM
jgi:hypothetical protein